MKVAYLLVIVLLVFGLPADAASNWKNLKADETGTPDRAWKGGNGLFEIQGVLGGATVKLQRKLAPVGDYKDVTPITTRDGAADCDLTADAEFCWFVAPGDSQIHPVVVGGDGTTDITVMVSGADQASISGIDASGDLTLTGRLIIPGGTVADPALSFSGDPDTGLFQSNPNWFQISLGGVEKLALKVSFLFIGGGGPALKMGESSSTVPSVAPIAGDVTTGLGGVTGEVSLITGGVQRLNARADGLVALLGNIGASPPATCLAGSTWIDTDETVDTNCTTANDNSLCCCIAADTWVVCGNVS